jgi:DNA-binding MarR family transcriptional regulator
MKQLHSDDFEVIERAFQRLMWAGQKQFGVLLAEHDLTFPQFLVLAAIHQHGVGCPVGTLAKEMFQSFPTMTGIVNRLKKSRLVERGDDPKDRRKVVITLTQEGQQLLNRAKASRRKQMIDALAGFSAQDRREFLRLLTIILATLEKENV